MTESITVTVTYRYLVPLVRNYCLMLLLEDKLQGSDLAGHQQRCYPQNMERSWEPVLASSAVANKAQAGAINNWEASKCFEHSKFPQILFSSNLSQDSLPREKFLH